jgi:hypothetical protein
MPSSCYTSKIMAIIPYSLELVLRVQHSFRPQELVSLSSSIWWGESVTCMQGMSTQINGAGLLFPRKLPD